ncbi:MAG: hypothetical protein ABI663_10605 [Chryseolinea sp.]
MNLNKSLTTITFILSAVASVNAQINWPTGPMMANAKVNSSGDLEITASKTSSEHDFEFLSGKWRMKHSRLKTRLQNNNEWSEFESTDENFGMMLNGLGNTDIYRATIDGKPFEGFTLRLFNPKTKLWNLYWVASNTGVLDPPVVGSFDGTIGRFYCKDIYQGTPVIVMFVWDKINPNEPVWYQAFSPDNGKTWEWNWTNTSYRIK